MNFSIGTTFHPSSNMSGIFLRIHLVGLYTNRLPVFRWKARGYDWILVDSIGQPSEGQWWPREYDQPPVLQSNETNHRKTSEGFNLHYYSTIMSFYHIRSKEQAKYEAVIHCSDRFTTGRLPADAKGATMAGRIRMFWILLLENRSQSNIFSFAVKSWINLSFNGLACNTRE